MWQRLLLVSYDSVFPGGWGERFIFVEQVPGEAPEDARLLLDCKLSPVKGKRERKKGGGGHFNTTNYLSWPHYKTILSSDR